jgi:hypothetical protein
MSPIHHEIPNGKPPAPAPEPVCLVRIHPDGERFYLEGWNFQASRPRVHPDPDRALWWDDEESFHGSEIGRGKRLLEELARRGFQLLTAAQIERRRRGGLVA